MERNYARIEINEEFKQGIHLLENSSKNVFITGRAGTGKSTLLQYWRQKTEKKIVVLAPTGVSAINVEGQTIHSFFGFKPGITPEIAKKLSVSEKLKEILQNLDIIVIDEISMVRADLLDCINEFLKIHGKKRYIPFGGIKMVFIGDLYQLPPVEKKEEKDILKKYETPFFFSSRAFHEIRDNIEFVELMKVYRQEETEFLEILNSIRNGSIKYRENLNLLEKLNERVFPDFEPPDDENYVYLSTTNKIVNEINEEKLMKLKGELYRFYGYIEGNFSKDELPVPRELKLKKGAQIMLLNNHPSGIWVNGTIGKVVDIREETIENGDKIGIIDIKLENGNLVSIGPHRWDKIEFKYDKQKDEIVSSVVGSYIQYPVKLAWAITVHKSQGLTFDKVIINLKGGIFAHGQLYVALSRCRSLSGLILKNRINPSHIWMDTRVREFITNFQYKLSSQNLSRKEKEKILKYAIKNRKEVKITYLKVKDEKTVRTVTPFKVGEITFNGKKIPVLIGYCHLRKEKRVFHLDRILSIEILTA